MEGVVENGLEFTNHLVSNHFEEGWDKTRKYINGKKVEETYTPYHGERDRQPSARSSSSSSNNRTGLRSATQGRLRSPDARGGAAVIGVQVAAPVSGGTALGVNTSASIPGSRRKQRNKLPSPDRNIHTERGVTTTVIQHEIDTNDRVLRQYEAELDDPKRNPASVLPNRDLWTLKETVDPRRDSAMAAGYNDNYLQTQYQGEGRARSAQPTRSRYDDDDSDYDERSGRRYRDARGRGYDDRDDRDDRYDRVVEETERYRGPVSSGPLVPVDRPWGSERRESYRSGYDGPYGAGAVTQYGRRSDGALDRTHESYVSRRSKSRGRNRDRSGSRTPSRSRSNSNGGGIRGKIEDSFDTSARGLGVGLAGAVIGGLAGREFGQKHRQRDIIIGALVGGLGANAAENRYREWREDKREKEDRWEEKYEGRSRSNVR